MHQFDYETAWIQDAWPLYNALPTSIHNLLSTVGIRCADLRQLADCSMPWPDGEHNADSLQAAFEAIPSEDLSFAAQVVYNAGHWFPGKAVSGDAAMPGREHGSHWKFAHYADQVLRVRLGLPARGSNGRENGYGFAVHEGAIRLTYADKHSWNWIEVAPATPAGLDRARQIQSRILTHVDITEPDKRKTHARDSARWQAFEHWKTEAKADPVWSDDWRRIADTSRYMVDDQELERRRLQRLPPLDYDALKVKAIALAEENIEHLRTELAGRLWLLDRREPIENVIYYNHTGLFCWGWREPLTSEAVSHVLEFISEFPYPYQIKQAKGPILEGGIR